MHYLLDENNIPYLEKDMTKIEKFYKNDRKILKQEKLSINNESVMISTVFLVLDYSFDLSIGHKPILWETMVFGGKFNLHQERYTSHKDALKGHKLIVSKIKRNAQTTN